MMSEEIVDRFTKNFAAVIVSLIFAAAAAIVVLCVYIPKIANEYLVLFGMNTSGHPVPFMIAMYAVCAAALWFLAELFFIMLSVKRGEPFVDRNVRSLNHMAGCCVIAAAALIFMLVMYGWYRDFSLYICAFILLFGALCAMTLSRVFAKAVEYKAENDLTV